MLWVPKNAVGAETSSASCDQAIFVDQATGASLRLSNAAVDYGEFEDVVGRNFRQPRRAGIRRLWSSAYVADDYLAQQFPVSRPG
jgi:hypothetical protein